MTESPEFFANLPNPARFREAIRCFDDENSRDPNTELFEGTSLPRELFFATQLTAWVMILTPAASEPLRLASRCQHICRWQIPRHKYPDGKAGYLRWRNELKAFHAQKAGEILQEVGYDLGLVSRVQELNLKKNFPADADARTLEDALCLVFLQHQFTALADKTSEEKMINALRKSWAKMTPAGHAAALKLQYSPREKHLLEKALEL